MDGFKVVTMEVLDAMVSTVFAATSETTDPEFGRLLNEQKCNRSIRNPSDLTEEPGAQPNSIWNQRKDGF